MNTTYEEKTATNELLEKCSVYLNDNFHKFSQSNKIKIALEIFKRKMPAQLEHSGEINFTAEEKIAYTNRIRHLLSIN